MPIERTYSPQEIATAAGVGYRAVIAWIKSGELAAVDHRAPGSTKPRYRVSESAWSAFQTSRQVQPKSTAPPVPTVRRRLPVDPEFARRLARARRQLERGKGRR